MQNQYSTFLIHKHEEGILCLLRLLVLVMAEDDNNVETIAVKVYSDHCQSWWILIV